MFFSGTQNWIPILEILFQSNTVSDTLLRAPSTLLIIFPTLDFIALLRMWSHCCPFIEFHTIQLNYRLILGLIDIHGQAHFLFFSLTFLLSFGKQYFVCFLLCLSILWVWPNLTNKQTKILLKYIWDNVVFREAPVTWSCRHTKTVNTMLTSKTPGIEILRSPTLSVQYGTRSTAQRHW